MIKKNFLTLALVALVGASSVGLVSCGDKASKTSVATASETTDGATLPVAYVRMDSVLSVYKYSLEVQEKLKADAEASDRQLQGRAAALQRAAEDFERRAKINAFVSQEAAQAEQAKVLKLQQEAGALQQKLAQDLAQKQALMQEDLMKEIEAQLKVFNNGRFKLILSNVGVLYADEAIDITEAFIQHLNDNYKSAGEATPADSTAKK